MDLRPDAELIWEAMETGEQNGELGESRRSHVGSGATRFLLVPQEGSNVKVVAAPVWFSNYNSAHLEEVRMCVRPLAGPDLCMPVPVSPGLERKILP